MSKTKQMVDEHRRELPIDHGKFLDDEYQVELYHKQWISDIEKTIGKPPPVSNCCESKLYLSLDNNNMICGKCKNYCEIK